MIRMVVVHLESEATVERNTDQSMSLTSRYL